MFTKFMDKMNVYTQFMDKSQMNMYIQVIDK